MLLIKVCQSFKNILIIIFAQDTRSNFHELFSLSNKIIGLIIVHIDLQVISANINFSVSKNVFEIFFEKYFLTAINHC